MSKSRQIVLEALTEHAQGHISKHVANVNLMLEHPAGVAEHPDYLQTIEGELKAIAEYMDQLEVLATYFDADVFDDDPEPEERPAKNFKLRHSA